MVVCPPLAVSKYFCNVPGMYVSFNEDISSMLMRWVERNEPLGQINVRGITIVGCTIYRSIYILRIYLAISVEFHDHLSTIYVFLLAIRASL